MKKEYDFSKGVKGKFFIEPENTETPCNSDDYCHNRPESVKRHREWQKSLKKDEFLNDIFGE